jgi:hypothetical protein
VLLSPMLLFDFAGLGFGFCCACCVGIVSLFLLLLQSSKDAQLVIVKCGCVYVMFKDAAVAHRLACRLENLFRRPRCIVALHRSSRSYLVQSDGRLEGCCRAASDLGEVQVWQLLTRIFEMTWWQERTCTI